MVSEAQTAVYFIRLPNMEISHSTFDRLPKMDIPCHKCSRKEFSKDQTPLFFFQTEFTHSFFERSFVVQLETVRMSFASKPSVVYCLSRWLHKLQFHALTADDLFVVSCVSLWLLASIAQIRYESQIQSVSQQINTMIVIQIQLEGSFDYQVVSPKLGNLVFIFFLFSIDIHRIVIFRTVFLKVENSQKCR